MIQSWEVASGFNSAYTPMIVVIVAMRLFLQPHHVMSGSSIVAL
jgi:hypothetical protein